MQTLEIIGTLVGLLYLYFEYKASIWLWAASIVMPAIYIFVYHDAGFYADMGINVYYLLASGYGWAMWLRRSRRGHSPAFGQDAEAVGAGTARSKTTRPGPERPGADGTDADHRHGHGAATSASGTGAGGDLANSTQAVAPAAQAAAVAETATISAPDARSAHAAGSAGPETATDAEATPAAAVSEPDTTASAAEKRHGSPEKTDTGVRPITHTPVHRWLPLAGTFLVAFAAIAFVLIRWTDSTVPYGDSFTTAMSIVGMWMLAQKYVEQWLVWIAVDVVCVGLYLYKGLYPTAGLYALYTVIAVFGYFKWLRMMKTQNAYA